MTPEQDRKLCRDFPILYSNRNGSISKTCMAWGFECGPGWFDLVYDLSAKLEVINSRIGKEFSVWRRILLLLARIPRILGIRVDVHGPEYVVAAQIKEKFGSLRFYYDGGGKYDDVIFGLVRQFEDISETVCEECGKPGQIRGRSWVRCRCDRCQKEYEEQGRIKT